VNNTIEKIKHCLQGIIELDWHTFNNLDMFEQADEWERLKTDFEKIIKEDYKRGELDFIKVYSFLKSYHGKFKSLPIEGKFYTNVNKSLLNPQLIGLVREIEYEDVKKNENPDCECELLSRFGKDPDRKGLKKLGVINDGYYMPKLYECKKCGFKWNSYVTDDSVGMTVFEKHSLEDDHLIEYD